MMIIDDRSPPSKNLVMAFHGFFYEHLMGFRVMKKAENYGNLPWDGYEVRLAMGLYGGVHSHGGTPSHPFD